MSLVMKFMTLHPDPNMPCKKNVAAPDVAMSASLVVMYDEELSYAEDNNDGGDHHL